ncbi:hypothetical protein BJ508DRAFT_141295 [Ascobolus immersus RN42]|uniref:Uncharacterized protein n=1 Tax=Ascobolus immersus RN42 TaxID=1160509 RepID=A0A3N4I1X9_ASCIM|nr:hypothetical protein BJ508DRAFT_141295 [Ascobolus immersus RN42]
MSSNSQLDSDYDSEADNFEEFDSCPDCWPLNKTLLIALQEGFHGQFEVRIRPSEGDYIVTDLLDSLILELEDWAVEYSGIDTKTIDPVELVLWMWDGFQMAVEMYRVLAENRERWVDASKKRVEVTWQAPPGMKGTDVEGLWRELWITQREGYESRVTEISRKTVEATVERTKEIIWAHYPGLLLDDYEPPDSESEDEDEYEIESYHGEERVVEKKEEEPAQAENQNETVPSQSDDQMVEKDGQGKPPHSVNKKDNTMEATQLSETHWQPEAAVKVYNKSTQTEDVMQPSQNDN